MPDCVPQSVQASEEASYGVSKAALLRFRTFYAGGYEAPDRRSRCQPGCCWNRLPHAVESHSGGQDSGCSRIERQGTHFDFRRYRSEASQDYYLKQLKRGDVMKKHDVEANRRRRNFLKAAGGAAVAFAAAKNTFGQSPNSKSAPQKDRGRSAPQDRGLW